MRILLIAFVLVVNAAAAWAEGAQPAMWKLSDADTSIYLFGTVHVLKPGTEWMTDKVEQAVTGADRLYMEISLAEQQNIPAIQQMVQRYAVLPADDALGNHLAPADAEKLKAGLAALGIAGPVADRFKPWFAGVTYSGMRFVKLGYDSTKGVEAALGELAQAHNVPIEGLETMEFQMRLFDSMTDEESRAFIQDLLKDDKDLGKMMSDITGSWTQGDLSALDREINDMDKVSPSLAEKLLYSRNQTWAHTIEMMLAQPGTFTVAVGSGHFVGKRSVIAILEKDGFTVERVQ